ncbi:hypothetical protein BJY52DRAFT_1230252 [Lactarius psammicola]|nr:hypothetical protein BJY52DRAFT_1230252 [Lactarius psammicola]
MPPKKHGSRGKDVHGPKSVQSPFLQRRGGVLHCPCCPHHTSNLQLAARNNGGQLPAVIASAISAGRWMIFTALYDLLPDGMVEGSQPQPSPPPTVKAKLQSAGGVDFSTCLYDMLPFAMEDDSPPPSPIAQSSLATTAKGVTSLAASFKDITFFTAPGHAGG